LDSQITSIEGVAVYNVIGRIVFIIELLAELLVVLNISKDDLVGMCRKHQSKGQFSD
jgi:hypothetical protein